MTFSSNFSFILIIKIQQKFIPNTQIMVGHLSNHYQKQFWFIVIREQNQCSVSLVVNPWTTDLSSSLDTKQGFAEAAFWGHLSTLKSGMSPNILAVGVHVPTN